MLFYFLGVILEAMLALRWYLLILYFIVYAAHPSSFAQTGTPQFYLYEDTTAQLNSSQAEQYLAEGRFKIATSNELNVGFTKSIFWLAYSNIENYPADSLLLYIGHHHINRIHFFLADSLGIHEQWVTGDYFPFAQRPINATGFYFPINKKGVYLAQIDKANESLQLSFYLISKVNAITTETHTKVWIFLFTGMILLLIIFGIYLLAISKDDVYLYYTLYIGCGWLWVLSNAGYGFQYIWPNVPWFASKARPVFAILPLIFSMLFLEKYIGGIKNKKIKFTIKLLNILLASSVICILLFNEKGYQTNWWLYIQYGIPYLSLAYVIVILSILITATIKGNRLAMFYLVAIIVLLCSAVLQISFSLGSLHSYGSFFSNYGLSIGYVVEAIVLTAGLVYRFNQYKLEKEALLIKLNKQQIENTQILMEAQEAERSQIANQLHDVVGSLLSAATLTISSLLQKNENNYNDDKLKLQKTEDAINLVANMVRNLSHALSPIMLQQVGFKTSIEKIVSIFNASGKINMELLIIGFEMYKPTLVNYYNAIYSILYELLNNTVKHSQATNALVQIIEHENLISIIIEDDGKGMVINNNIDTPKGLGLLGVQSKVVYLNGSIAFDVNQPTGIIISIEIPIQ